MEYFNHRENGENTEGHRGGSLRYTLRALWLKQKRKISSNQEIYHEPFPISPILTLTPSHPRFSKSKHPMKTIHRMSGQALTYDVSRSSYVYYRLRPWKNLTTEKTEKIQRAAEAVLCGSLRSALRALWLKQKRKISSNQEIYREPFPISLILTLTPSHPRFSKSKHPMKTIHRMSGQALTYDVSKSSYVYYRVRPWNILTTEKTEKTQRATEEFFCGFLL